MLSQTDAVTSSQPRRKLTIRKKLLFSAMVGLMALLLALVVGEGLLRWRFRKIDQITGYAEWQPGEFGDLTYHWDRYHEKYGWTNVPDYRSDERIPFQVTFNSQGLRATRDYEPAPPAGVTRLALFGDSCTFGEEVDDDQTISHYLEQQLASAEALNYGVHGFGLGQMMLRLEEEGFALDPDHVVIVILLPMDIYRDSMRQYVYNKPVFAADDHRLRVDNVPVPEAAQLPWLYRRCYTAAWLFARAAPHEMPMDARTYVDTTRAILARVKARCDSRGVGLTVVTLISYGTAEELRTDFQLRRYLDYITAEIRGLEIDVLDLIPFLKRADEAEGSALEMPLGHWSPRGNCLIADQLAQHLAAATALELAEQSAAVCKQGE